MALLRGKHFFPRKSVKLVFFSDQKFYALQDGQREGGWFSPYTSHMIGGEGGSGQSMRTHNRSQLGFTPPNEPFMHRNMIILWRGKTNIAGFFFPGDTVSSPPFQNGLYFGLFEGVYVSVWNPYIHSPPFRILVHYILLFISISTYHSFSCLISSHPSFASPFVPVPKATNGISNYSLGGEPSYFTLYVHRPLTGPSCWRRCPRPFSPRWCRTTLSTLIRSTPAGRPRTAPLFRPGRTRHLLFELPVVLVTHMCQVWDMCEILGTETRRRRSVADLKTIFFGFAPALASVFQQASGPPRLHLWSYTYIYIYQIIHIFTLFGHIRFIWLHLLITYMVY